MRARLAGALAVGAGLVAACSSGPSAAPGTAPPVPSTTAAAETATTSTAAPTTAAPTTAAPTIAALTTLASTTIAPEPATTATTIPVAVARAFPIAAAASYGRTHHDYPATDVFARCGAPVVAPVDGVLLEVRREDAWSATTDNPATRGGRSLSILGDDGVRYYLAHLDTIEPAVAPGSRVAAGQPVATVGRTGRASACHLHVALSPPCPGKEWSVRRGVVWPWPYLDAWRAGSPTSPAPEVQAWLTEHPTACAEAMADPHAPDA